MSNPPKTILIQPVSAGGKSGPRAFAMPSDGGGIEYTALFQAEQKIYPRSVKGIFSSLRWLLVWMTQLFFYGLPWLLWGERQAVLFNLNTQHFYIFGLVLYPQDFIYLAGLLVISALSLFLFTAVAGRLWCGYACPQTVYTEMFLWLEKLVEGDRMRRIKLDQLPWSFEKIWRKTTKHVLWLVLALWTGITFVGFFSPIRDLVAHLATFAIGNWELFWILFYGFATYGNAGWLREQVCKYMCPYARFQSAMFDRDTLIVTYDAQRGEPRTPPTRKTATSATELAGDCIDCGLCVQVCPTGIDIRKGLQYECIGCGACADVCDMVMDKIDKPRGLVKYSTENALLQHLDHSQILRRVLRPRVLIYSAIALTVTVAILLSLFVRSPMRLDVVRDRGSMARFEGRKLENVYRLQVMNLQENKLTYVLSVEGIAGLSIATPTEITLEPATATWLPTRVQLSAEQLPRKGSYDIRFVLRQQDQPATMIREKSIFYVPN